MGYRALIRADALPAISTADTTTPSAVSGSVTLVESPETRRVVQLARLKNPPELCVCTTQKRGFSAALRCSDVPIRLIVGAVGGVVSSHGKAGTNARS